MSADQDGCNFNKYNAPSGLDLADTQFADEYRRICKIVGSNPDGLTIEEIATKLHGLDDADLPIDGSDSRYQRIRRFVPKHPFLFDTVSNNGIEIVRPTLDLISLIFSGISQRPSDQYIDAKTWCKNLLKTTRPEQDESGSINFRLSNSQKWHIVQSFADYIGRIDDLRIILEALEPDTKPKYLSLPYKTRFNNSGRVSKQFSILDSAFSKAGQMHEKAAYGTLTTDPAHFDSLWDSIVDINKNWNRFMSWISSDSRLGYRPEYVKILEFQESGNPHLHFVIFLRQRDNSMPWLVDKDDLDDYWSKWQGGYVNDLQPLIHQTDLGSDYEADSGWVRWRSNGNHGGLIDHERNDDSSGNQTAEQYLGKYLTKTFGMVEEIAEDGSAAVREAYNDSDEAFKLALYWATDRKIKTISRDLRQLVEDDLDDDDPEDELGEILAQDYRVVGAFLPDNIPIRITRGLRHFENVTNDDDDDDDYEIFAAAPPPPDDVLGGGYKIK